MKLPFKPAGLLFDLDGTLLDRERKVKPEIVELFALLREKGVRIGACTGRPFPSLFKEVLPFFSPQDKHIIGGGAEVITGRGYNVVWSRRLPSEVVKRLYRRLKAVGAKLVFSQGEKGYTNRLDMLPRIAVGAKFADPEDVNLEDWTTSLLVVDHLTAEIEAELHKLQMEEKITLKRMTHHAGSPDGDFYYDVTVAGANKGETAKAWAREWGVELEKVVMFGDNANDIDALQAVGWGVVVESGTIEAKKVADEIIPSVNEGGIQAYLREIGEKIS